MKLGYTFFPQNYISDPIVMMMSPSQRGIYRDLIDLAYMNENKITFSEQQLSRYTGGTPEEVLEVLNMKGEKIDDYWTIPSCARRIAASQKNRTNGSLGGRPKKGTKTQNNPIITQNEKNHNPNHNPTVTQTKRQREREREREREIKNTLYTDVHTHDVHTHNGVQKTEKTDVHTKKKTDLKSVSQERKDRTEIFERFWLQYPVKKNKKMALAVFLKLTEGEINDLRRYWASFLKNYNASLSRSGKNWELHCETFLKYRRWLDEFDEPGKTKFKFKIEEK